jgi:uncharacterized protein YkwD
VRNRFAVLAAAALGLACWPGQAEAAACGVPAGTPTTRESEAAFERATACELAEVRAARSLPALRRARGLDRAAERQARDMVERRYFSHTSPEGDDVLDRVRASHYLRRWPSFRLGEVLAWGTGSLGSPPAIVQAWLNSPGHRRLVLKRGFRDVGIGVVAGYPFGSAAGATYAVVFGRRERN